VKMAIKCIAIGSRLMADDQIGVAVLEEITSELKSKEIEAIISETDTFYALSRIENGDFLFVLDATYLGIKPGTVTCMPIAEAISERQRSNSLHQESLIDLLRISKIAVEGFFIGIEVDQLAFCFELSESLKTKLPVICSEVMGIIDFILDNKLLILRNQLCSYKSTGMLRPDR